MNLTQLKDLAELMSSAAVSDTMKALVVVGVLALVLWRGARLYLQPEAPFNLLTPTEHRLRQRLANLQEQAATTTDPLMLEVMAEERGRMQFHLLHGIDAKASFRRELVGLYHAGGPLLNWTDVRQALPYLKYEEGKVVPGISRIDKVFSTILLVMAALLLLLGVLVGTFTPVVLGATGPAEMIAAILTGAPLFVVAWLMGSMALPVVRAQQLQKAVERWRAQSSVGELQPGTPAAPTASPVAPARAGTTT